MAAITQNQALTNTCKSNYGEFYVANCLKFDLLLLHMNMYILHLYMYVQRHLNQLYISVHKQSYVLTTVQTFF